MVPSGSTEPAASRVTARSLTTAPKAAVGAAFGSTVGATRRPDQAAVTERVAVADRYVVIPTPPAVCSPAVASVALTCQDAGSAAEAAHTFARMVVGEVPVTCTRVARV